MRYSLILMAVGCLIACSAHNQVIEKPTTRAPRVPEAELLEPGQAADILAARAAGRAAVTAETAPASPKLTQTVRRQEWEGYFMVLANPPVDGPISVVLFDYKQLSRDNPNKWGDVPRGQPWKTELGGALPLPDLTFVGKKGARINKVRLFLGQPDQPVGVFTFRRCTMYVRAEDLTAHHGNSQSRTVGSYTGRFYQVHLESPILSHEGDCKGIIKKASTSPPARIATGQP